MIMSIPLSKWPEPDKLIWIDLVIGQFSMKSTYFKARLAIGKENNLYKDRSNIWKSIWIVRVIPKVRMFI